MLALLNNVADWLAFLLIRFIIVRRMEERKLGFAVLDNYSSGTSVTFILNCGIFQICSFVVFWSTKVHTETYPSHFPDPFGFLVVSETS